MLILSEICQILRQLTLNYKNSECLVITESLYHAEYFYLSPQYRLKKHHKNHQSKIMILVVNEMKWDGKNIHANNTKHIINYLTIAILKS